MGYEFIDSDLLIQAQKCLLKDIIEERTRRFYKIETKLSEIETSKCIPVVIYGKDFMST